MWPPRAEAGRVGVVFLALFVVLTLAIAVGTLVFDSVRLAYRAGWAGTPGPVSSVSCTLTGSGGSARENCTADFAPVDGQAVLRDVDIEGSTACAGSRDYPALPHSDTATVSVVGAKTVAYLLRGMLFALFLAERAGIPGRWWSGRSG